ncbi:MAG: hypothetical protein JRG91_06875 [Deltaproteobacteria bacterium]|nr:hypothetical protein [Deltaproteobacteria bacterium]
MGRRAHIAVAAAVLLLGAAALWAAAADQGGLLRPSTLGIEAHHETHVVEKSIGCAACHEEAPTSSSSKDLLLPSSDACLACHPEATCTGPLTGACRSCHASAPRSILSARFEHAGKAAIRFDHEKHTPWMKGGCTACHSLDPARPDDRNPLLPSMQACIECHPHDKAFASDLCVPCHVKTKKGTLALAPAGKTLTPPAWMHGADHDGAWVLTHAPAAATRPGLCAACHTDRDCAACHAGKVKPESIHPGDWLNFHPVSANLGELRCSACHSYQAFCLTCHRKAGVAWDSPSTLGVPAGNVFHPPGWYSLGGPSKHSVQARKNLSSCVSCHTESDCITCHSSSSTFSVSPHPSPGLWLDKCRLLAKKNPTSCLKCHPSVPLQCR